MINVITSWFSKRRQEKALEAFRRQYEFTLHGNMGFAIHHLVVSEFGYLLRHVTEGRHHHFDCFTALARDEQQIDNAIDKEISRDIPREAEVNMTTVAGARHNLENLRRIVFVIARYVEFAKEHGLPADPLLVGRPAIRQTAAAGR